MAYRKGIEEQSWSKEEMAAYWAENIDGKRPIHLQKADQTMRSARSQHKVQNLIPRTSLSKTQYLRYQEKGITDAFILDRYPELTKDQLQIKKKTWGIV